MDIAGHYGNDSDQRESVICCRLLKLLSERDTCHRCPHFTGRQVTKSLLFIFKNNFIYFSFLAALGLCHGAWHFSSGGSSSSWCAGFSCAAQVLGMWAS